MSYQHAFLGKKNIKIGEFLRSYFNTEDGRENNIFDILYYFKKGKKHWSAKQDLHCMEKMLWQIWTCWKWLVKFRAGDFSLDDAPWSGRPVEIND